MVTFGVSRRSRCSVSNLLGLGCGLVSLDESPWGPACPGVGDELSDDTAGQARVGDADGDQTRAMPVFRAGMRPFGYGFCDGLLAEGEVDSLIIQAAGETRPAVDAEGRAAAVIVFLGPGKAERKPPHLFGIHFAHTTSLHMTGLGDRSSFDDQASRA